MKLQTKRIICLVVAIASFITIVGTVSYAYFSASADVKKEQTAELTAGTMTVKFADRGDGIDEVLNFGESVIKKFTITNTGTLESSIKLNFVDLVNTYTTGSLTYTLLYSETEEGEYSEVVGKTNVPASTKQTKKTLAKKITLPVGATYYYNLVIELNYLNDVDQNGDFEAKFSTRFGAEDVSAMSPIEKIIASSKGTKTSFDKIAIGNEGVFEMEDDYGTSYYYRGAVTNNYVKFGKWNENTPVIYRGQVSETNMNSWDYSTLEECQNASYYNVNCTMIDRAGKDMYWRIVRINGDGSLKIIYDGTSAYANGKSNSNGLALTNVAWNITNYDDTKYVGYMYGGENGTASTSKEQAQTNEISTNIKTQLEGWYKNNIIDTGYSSAVADILFCNDRTIPGKNQTGWSSDTGLGYRKKDTAYGATSRTGVWNSSTTPSAPTFKCPEKNDSFTVSDTTKGNGDLTYPVGLITADEIVMAGGKFGTANRYYYLYKGPTYWSLSPFYYYNDATVFSVYSDARLYHNTVTHASGVAPVINIAAEYVEKMIGEGTIESPYEIVYNN